ncbi:MAG: hypothetical protein ABI679_10795 [Gemmatimonadota bacterium]
MNRRGFALLAVLWLIAALAILVSGGLALARTGLTASSNRVMLARAGWAREACVEIMMQRGFSTNARSHHQEVTGTRGSVDLGRTTWCSLQVEDPAGRINLNLADKASLQRLLGDSLSDALLDWRDPDNVPRPLGAEVDWYRMQRRSLPRDAPLASVNELRLIRGFDSLMVDRLASLLTVRGHGALNLNSASSAAIGALLQLPDEVIGLLERQRSFGRPVENLDQLMSLCPPSYRPALMARYQDLSQLVVFSPPELVVIATGGVGNSPLTARATLTVVLVSDRVAVIRREVE